MSERPMDEFDLVLRDQLTALGSEAVGLFDAAAIAHAAVVFRVGSRVRIGFRIGPRARIALAAAALGLLALVAALIAASTRHRGIGDAFASPVAAAWSPDGSTLAFVVNVAEEGSRVGSAGRASDFELWVVDGDGTDPRELARLDGTMLRAGWVLGPPRPFYLDWAPDGRAILATAEAPGTTGDSLLSVGLDGSAPRVLVAGTETQLPRPGGWSLSGGQLLYLRDGGFGGDLYVLDLGAGTERRLTTSHSASVGEWSPDGQWVLYSDGAFTEDGRPGPDASTRVVSADGSRSYRLGSCCDLGWSADGGRAYFGAGDGATYSAAPDGSDAHLAFEGDVTGWYPSPDGSQVLASTLTGAMILRPGRAPTMLTTEMGGPAGWSPDGRWIAFWEGSELFVLPASGGPAHRVATNAGSLGTLWRPGVGSPELTFTRDRAIVSIAPDGTDLHDLVSRSTIAGDPLGAPEASGQATIVIGPGGPDRDVYRVSRSTPDMAQITVENRTDNTWVPGRLAGKPMLCHLVSGQAASNPCSVAAHSSISVDLVDGGYKWGLTLEVLLAPEGIDWKQGVPVIVDVEPYP